MVLYIHRGYFENDGGHFECYGSHFEFLHGLIPFDTLSNTLPQKLSNGKVKEV